MRDGRIASRLRLLFGPESRTRIFFGEFHAMALSSMTGFARSHGASGPYVFEWELKSVNAKGWCSGYAKKP